MKLCKAARCDRENDKHGARGYCSKHYKRLMAGQDPDVDPVAPPETRYMCRENRGGPDACWEWLGHRDIDGYGSFWVGDRSERAHRVAWERAHGPIPAGLCVLHHCDNPPCVNPGHLFLGTIADNNRDKAQKGRARGNTTGNLGDLKRRLTAEEVAEIRAFGNPYYGARAGLARRYGVSHQHICAIQLGQRRQAAMLRS